MFHNYSDDLVKAFGTDNAEPEVTLLVGHWKLCNEILDCIGMQYTYLINGVHELKLLGDTFENDLCAAELKTNSEIKSKYAQHLLQSCVDLYLKEATQYSTGFGFGNSSAMIESGLGYLIGPIAGCLELLAQNTKNCGIFGDYAYGNLYDISPVGSAARMPAESENTLLKVNLDILGSFSINSWKFREFWYYISSCLYAKLPAVRINYFNMVCSSRKLYSDLMEKYNYLLSWKASMIHMVQHSPPLLIFNHADVYSNPAVGSGSLDSNMPYEILALIGSTSTTTTFPNASPASTSVTTKVTYSEPLHSNCILLRYFDIYKLGSIEKHSKVLSKAIIKQIRSHLIDLLLSSNNGNAVKAIKSLPFALLWYLSSVVHLERLRIINCLDLRIYFLYIGRYIIGHSADDVNTIEKLVK